MKSNIYIIHHTNVPKYELPNEESVRQYFKKGLLIDQKGRYHNTYPGSPNKCDRILFSWKGEEGFNIYGELWVDRKLDKSEFTKEEKEQFASTYLISKVALYKNKIPKAKAREIIGKDWYQYPTPVSQEKYEKIMNLTHKDFITKEIEDLDKDLNETLSSTEMEAVIKTRIGQSVFRQELLDKYKQCVVCGIELPELLIASHIKPWRDAEEEERLDTSNGLLLCVLHDKLFDRGYFTFNPDGELIPSKELTEKQIKLFQLSDKPISLTDPTIGYLKYHKEKIFET